MSAIRKGDHVRFLNSVGDGVVTRVTADGKVFVRDETGFEIPFFANEVVVVEEGSTIVPKVQTPSKAGGGHDSAHAPVTEPAPRQRDDRKRPMDRDKVNAYLCYLPEVGQNLGDAAYEVYLVNDSAYDLSVFYSSGRDDRRQVRYRGTVPFDSIELLETFTPRELNDRARTSLVLTPFMEESPFPRKEPAIVEVKVEGTKFFKKNAFVPNDFFDDDAIIYPVVRDDRPVPVKKVNAEKLAEAMMEKEKAPAPAPKRRREGARVRHNDPLVIDLHIEELLDTTAGMGHKEILDYQLEEVRKVMEAHCKPQDKGMQIVFIHGKGNGVLRQQVLALLRREYPRSETRDASFQEYGFGATLVTIR